MTKKVFDILPPEEPTPSSPPPPRRFFAKTEEEPAFIPQDSVPQIIEPRKRIRIKWVWFLVPLFLITGFAFSSRLSRAQIKIWPETETVAFETELVVDANIKESNFENKVISGEIFEVEETASESFPASGNTLKKAEGIIRLYNAYTTESENWLAGTRFVSSEGKMFRSKDGISVPGATKENGRIVANSVDVPVIAAEPGEDYNIGSSSFSIPSFKTSPTSRYTDFYGESFEPMKGGGQSAQVTEQDLEKAEESLVEKAKEKSIQALQKNIGEQFVFLDGALITEVVDKFSFAQAGEAVEKFNFKVKAKSSTIIFKKEDIEKFAANFINSQISQDKVLYEDSLKIDYVPQIIDLESKKITLSLNFLGKIYPENDLYVLKKGLIGKSLAETEAFLENYPGIMKAEVKFTPFWVKTTPKDLDKNEISYPIVD
jgi:hypothetical protein